MSENRKCVNRRHNIRKEIDDLTEYAKKLGGGVVIDKYLNKITCGDCYELIKELPDKSIDAMNIAFI